MKRRTARQARVCACVCVPGGGVCVYAGHVWIPPGSTSRESKRGPTRAAGEELALL